MQTSKYEIGANLQGLEFRRQANEILAALASSNAGNLEPASAQAGTVWLDTSNDKKHLLKIRNKANSAWGILCSIDAQSGVVDTIDAYTKQESDGKFALKTDFADHKAADGYTKLPNGLIIQWGRISVPAGGKARVTYPIVFPNVRLMIFIGSLIDAASNSNGTGGYHRPNPFDDDRAGFDVVGMYGFTASYIAIGY